MTVKEYWFKVKVNQKLTKQSLKCIKLKGQSENQNKDKAASIEDTQLPNKQPLLSNNQETNQEKKINN